VHVGDLVGVGDPKSNGKWKATVTITVHDAGDDPVLPGATVSGDWSDGANGSGNCVTNNSSGQCSISKQSIKANVGNVTFTVIDISSGGSPFIPAHHGPDADTIPVLSPY